MTINCIICGKSCHFTNNNYACCPGIECHCGGRPAGPEVCSQECLDKFHEKLDYEQSVIGDLTEDEQLDILILNERHGLPLVITKELYVKNLATDETCKSIANNPTVIVNMLRQLSGLKPF